MSSPRAFTEHAKPSPRAYVHIYLKPKCLCPAMPSPRAYTMIPMKAGLPVQCQAYHGVLFKEDCMIYHASDCFLHFCSLQGFCSFVGLGSLLLLCCKVDKFVLSILGLHIILNMYHWLYSASPWQTSMSTMQFWLQLKLNAGYAQPLWCISGMADGQESEVELGFQHYIYFATLVKSG